MTEAPTPAAEDSVPLLSVVAGHPTSEELAALVAVVAARRAGGAAASASPPVPSAWSAPMRAVRMRHHHGPGGWRSSAFPR